MSTHRSISSRFGLTGFTGLKGIAPALVALVGLTALTSACAPADDDAAADMDTAAAMADDAMDGMDGAMPEVDDADIAAIVVAANSADIANGELALENATDQRVRDFAQQMIDAHTAVNESATQLVTELGVTPTRNPVGQSITDGQTAAREELSQLSGAAFDSAYIANEVTYHQAVIDALDNVLIPSAENAQLEQTLVDVRPAFVSHLDQAEQLAEALSAGE